VSALTESARELSLIAASGLQPISPVPFQVSLGNDRQSIRIEFPGPPLAAGRYKVVVPFTYDKAKTDSATVFLTVQK
jgi:hypothetical protein